MTLPGGECLEGLSPSVILLAPLVGENCLCRFPELAVKPPLSECPYSLLGDKYLYGWHSAAFRSGITLLPQPCCKKRSRTSREVCSFFTEKKGFLATLGHLSLSHGGLNHSQFSPVP